MRFGRRALSASTMLGLLCSPAALAKGRGLHAKDPHSAWANPAGVLVTSDGGKISPPEKKNKDDDDPPTPAADAEFAQLVKAITSDFTKCLTALRAATPELQKSGGRYGFTMDFAIAVDGKVYGLTQAKRGGSAPLPDCAKQINIAISGHVFKPPAEKQALDGHVEYDVVILTDEDAQGRGFQYIAGEKAWEKALRANAVWFRCRTADDCAVTAELCEVRGVAKESLTAYRLAIGQRKKPPCYKKYELERYKTACLQQKCAAIKPARRPAADADDGFE